MANDDEVKTKNIQIWIINLERAVQYFIYKRKRKPTGKVGLSSLVVSNGRAG